MRQAELEEYRGISPSPVGFESFWKRIYEKSAFFGVLHIEKLDFANDFAEYREIRFEAANGRPLYARYLCPPGTEPVPTVLMYHDHGRGIRGWHHMTRFPALGYAVLALENRSLFVDAVDGFENAPEGLSVVSLFSDAMSLSHVALSLPRTNPRLLVSWGEGLGGGMAVAVAAMTPFCSCAALNPVPADYRKVWEQNCFAGIYGGLRNYFRTRDPEHRNEDALFQALGYVDCANFAPYLRKRLLLGTSLMDEYSPAETQYALFNRAVCEKRHFVYPKYLHERINSFENELLVFLNEELWDK